MKLERYKNIEVMSKVADYLKEQNPSLNPDTHDIKIQESYDVDIFVGSQLLCFLVDDDERTERGTTSSRSDYSPELWIVDQTLFQEIFEFETKKIFSFDKFEVIKMIRIELPNTILKP